MEKSIESIWSQGFLEGDELVAPKLNDLYNKKSQLLIEKIRRVHKIDNMMLIPMAALFAAGFWFAGYPILGIYLAGLMLLLYFLNRKKLAGLENIKINSSSYEYLVEYQRISYNLKRFYTRLVGFGFPIATMIAYYLYFRNTEVFDKLFGLDILYISIILFVILLILSGMGVLNYFLVTKLVYGRLLRKLDEIIEDMRELRN